MTTALKIEHKSPQSKISYKELYDIVFPSSLPPSAIPEEECVLGALMLDHSAFAIVKDLLKAEYFSLKAHQLIYAACESLNNAHKPIDFILVIDQLKRAGHLEKVGGPAFVIELTNKLASAANIEVHAMNIYEQWMRRDGIEKCIKRMYDFKDPVKDVFDIRNNFSDELRVLPPKSFFKVTGFNKSIESGAKAPNLDKMCGHLWNKTEVAFFFGPPGTGKSIFAIQVADAVSKGKDVVPNILINECGPQKVLYIDFELTDRNIKNRYSSDEDPNKHYTFDDDNLLRAVINPDFLDYDERLDKIAQKQIESLILTHNPEVMIVDNITFLTSESSQDTEVASKLMKKLIYYKRKYGMSLLVIAHTTKAYSPFSPLQDSDMAGSAQLQNFADALFGIKRSAMDEHMIYLKQFKDRNEPMVNGSENVLTFTTGKGGADNSFLSYEYHTVTRELQHLATPDDDAELMKLQIKKAVEIYVNERGGYRKVMKAIGWDRSLNNLRTRMQKYARESEEYEFEEETGNIKLATPF